MGLCMKLHVIQPLKGKDGKSAYQIAVDNGFIGTEQEWLNSLKGEPGTTNYDDLENKPTKLSDFTNDGVFVTNTVNDLVNYYTKSETYTKTEINNLISSIPKFNILVVQDLPTENISNTTIYLIPSNSEEHDIYKEYIYVNNNWELLGIQKVDLTDYYNKTEVNSLLSSKVDTNSLSTVATSGLYSDLSGKPTKLSDFTNDSGFINNAVNDLVNYYTKSETYTKTEINNLISSIPKFNILVVQDLPTENISNTTIYLVPYDSGEYNIYKEYIYVNNSWELLGTQSSDLTNYYNKTEIDTLLSDKANTNDLAIVATSGLYSDLTGTPSSLSDFSGTLPISKGGTGATTASTAKTTLGFSTATSLYSNSSGTHSTITLSDDISNYDSIGIYCFWESKNIYSARYYEFLGSPSAESLYNVRPAIRTSSEEDSGNGVVLSGYKITLNSNSITFETYTTNKSIYITSNSSTNSSEFYGRYITNQTPYITKVVGYKY